MKNKRNRRLIDSTDGDTLRLLYHKKKPLTGNRIAKSIGISPSALSPRLKRLHSNGIIKPVRIGGTREFKRKFGDSKKYTKIIAPRSISWALDIKTHRKG